MPKRLAKGGTNGAPKMVEIDVTPSTQPMTWLVSPLFSNTSGIWVETRPLIMVSRKIAKSKKPTLHWAGLVTGFVWGFAPMPMVVAGLDDMGNGDDKDGAGERGGACSPLFISSSNLLTNSLKLLKTAMAHYA